MIKKQTSGSQKCLLKTRLQDWRSKTTQNQLTIIHLPDMWRRSTIWTIRAFTSSRTYGPIEFFMTMMVMDTRAPEYGKHRLKEYSNEQVNKNNQE